jgi:adenylate kinase family enzyme
MRKILVIGSGGAGKSVFATRLGEVLQIEVLHLDKFYWRPGWTEMPKSEWRKTVEQLLQRDAWIMDGNYSGTLDLRLEACDTVIFLDISRLVCLWHMLKRGLKYRNVSRPDMAEGCHEKVDPKFISWVWNYSKRSRPKIVELLKSNSDKKKIIWLRSHSDVKRFLTETRLLCDAMNTE